MARVPFPAGLVGVENLPRTRRSLQNCFNNLDGKIVARPGIKGLNTTGKVARGQFVWNGNLYQVVSGDLIRIDDVDTGAFTVIGTINGVERIETDVGFNEAVIVVVADDGKTYTLDEAETLTDIAVNPNFVPNRDVAYINGRFVYIPYDGDPAYFSDVGDAGSVQPESFFDAEELPDKNNSVFNFKNTLYIGGTDSLELFRDTGASPNPFIRVTGSRITNGVIGGVLEYNETFLFIGREAKQDFGIYAIGQGLAPKISNEFIDLILKEYTQAELEQAVPGRLKWNGYDMATFALSRNSFGFFGGNWFSLDSVQDSIRTTFKAGFITQYLGKYYTAFEDRIGVFDGRNTDYGEPIVRIIDTGFEQEDGEWFACQSMKLGISQGFSRPPGSVAILMSRDGLTYGDPLYREVAEYGDYAKQLEWNYPGGLGSYEGFMGVRIYTTGDVEFSSDYLTANFR